MTTASILASWGKISCPFWSWKSPRNMFEHWPIHSSEVLRTRWWPSFKYLRAWSIKLVFVLIALALVTLQHIIFTASTADQRFCQSLEHIRVSRCFMKLAVTTILPPTFSDTRMSACRAMCHALVWSSWQLDVLKQILNKSTVLACNISSFYFTKCCEKFATQIPRTCFMTLHCYHDVCVHGNMLDALLEYQKNAVNYFHIVL